MKKQIMLILALCSSLLSADAYFEQGVHADANCEALNLNVGSCGIFGKTFFSIRPQDSNSVRRILEYRNGHNLVWKDDCAYHYLTMTVEYQRTFKNSNLASWFFFNGFNCMTVGIPSDELAFDVDGSQLGLSLGNEATSPYFSELTPGLIGTMCVCPQMSNVIFDIDLYTDLRDILCGLWFAVEAPIVRAKTSMRLCTTGGGQTAEPFPLGPSNASEFSFGCVETPVPYSNIAAAFGGDRGWGAVPPLAAAKYCSGSMTKTAVAGVHLDLGYDFFNDDCAYFGMSIHTVAPTGNRPKGTFVFEPIVGANKSWQLGLTLEAFREWQCDNDVDFGLYFYAVGTHLFKSRQTRTFTLRNNGAGSQYLLLKVIDSSSTTLTGLERAANVFTGEFGVGADFMFDASLMAQWSYCNWFADVGYNLWVRTQEKRSDSIIFRNFRPSAYGIKGNEATSFNDDFLGCLGDATTASTSTIAQPGPADLLPDETGTTTVFLRLDDIDFTSPLHPTAWSNKVFGSVGYNYTVCDRDAYILLAGEVEFGRKCNALNQWGIMVQGGFEF